jgi:hypothetical protein
VRIPPAKVEFETISAVAPIKNNFFISFNKFEFTGAKVRVNYTLTKYLCKKLHKMVEIPIVSNETFAHSML